MDIRKELGLNDEQMIEINDAIEFNPYKLFTGIFLPECLVSYKKLSPGAKICYGVLVKFCGEKGFCWPKQQSVADKLGISIEMTKRYITELKREGFIKTIRRGLTKSNIYIMLLHPIFKNNIKFYKEAEYVLE